MVTMRAKMRPLDSRCCCCSICSSFRRIVSCSSESTHCDLMMAESRRSKIWLATALAAEGVPLIITFIGYCFTVIVSDSRRLVVAELPLRPCPLRRGAGEDYGSEYGEQRLPQHDSHHDAHQQHDDGHHQEQGFTCCHKYAYNTICAQR